LFTWRAKMKAFIKLKLKRLLCYVVPELSELGWLKKAKGTSIFESEISDSEIGNVKLFPPYNIYKCRIGIGTYVARNSFMSFCEIGKYCSIGPNVICGWGIHPLDGLSTSPVFYSTANQAGFYYSGHDKVQERKPIKIGNDVTIGMNVNILDGVSIGNGAVIGAGTTVSKNIPPYAIAYGSPVAIVRYRFNPEQIRRLEKIKWWDFEDEQIREVEKYFFNVDDFINRFDP
jgi:virginiamycin A acetyltransferase